MAALETESATLNPWGGRDHRIVGGGMLRTTNEDGERSLIRLDQNGVHLYSVRFDPGTPDEVVADAFYLALRFDEPPPPFARFANPERVQAIRDAGYSVVPEFPGDPTDMGLDPEIEAAFDMLDRRFGPGRCTDGRSLVEAITAALDLVTADRPAVNLGALRETRRAAIDATDPGEATRLHRLFVEAAEVLADSIIDSEN